MLLLPLGITTLKSAQINGRQWIGIDQSDEAIKATTEKLNDIKGDLFVSQTDSQLWTEKKHRSHYTDKLVITDK